MLQMLVSIAKFERNQLAENVKLGMMQKASKGEWNGGTILGYDVVEGPLVVNAAEKVLVNRIFELYTLGKGLTAIANQLNKEGYKTKNGNPHSIGSIRTIIHNPTYIGKIRWGQVDKWSKKRRKGKKDPLLVDGQHEAIISIDLWNRAQELIEQKVTTPSRQFTGKFLLAGALKCPQCGVAMVGTNHNRTLATGEKNNISSMCVGTSIEKVLACAPAPWSGRTRSNSKLVNALHG